LDNHFSIYTGSQACSLVITGVNGAYSAVGAAAWVESLAAPKNPRTATPLIRSLEKEHVSARPSRSGTAEDAAGVVRHEAVVVCF